MIKLSKRWVSCTNMYQVFIKLTIMMFICLSRDKSINFIWFGFNISISCCMCITIILKPDIGRKSELIPWLVCLWGFLPLIITTERATITMTRIPMISAADEATPLMIWTPTGIMIKQCMLIQGRRHNYQSGGAWWKWHAKRAKNFYPIISRTLKYALKSAFCF